MTAFVRLTAFAAAAFALAVPDLAAAQTVLRYAHVGAEGESQTRYAAELAELVKEKTDGRVVIQVFPGSQLGNLSEMIDGVRIGSIQMAHHDFSSLDRIEPDVAVFNAPFAYRNPEHAMKATAEATSPVMREINKKLVEKGGVRIVGNFYRGARQLTARYPVYSPKDMEGKKFRAVPVPLWNSMIKGMGAIPTPVEISEIMPALMTGLVEGQENPLNNIIARKMYEANKYVMMTSHMESVLAVFVNEEAWQKIPEADRALMQEAFDEMAQRSLQWARDAEAGEIQFLKDNGVTIIDASNGLDIEAFREAVGKQIRADYPGWSAYLEQIAAIE
ncbi:tripartite ATP-independent transporter DctP family solute receptor [Tepidamorphus gemmatus]|uniref:Tripartite ATP-independent transporter DctP family solute receptor n=1 Tax=Tepidamorphus gemmatus TaxID=747076 RepID=A0A4R3MB64_9HYPH|nr:TRAP transporter substrate-binding protein [Tepidamorphus gemmatus]TCT10546.1 tripartite ATP-independent transporter DctP family solute receptor [Tepidamorphus gemmatus]